jgi:hypothetical protein
VTYNIDKQFADGGFRTVGYIVSIPAHLKLLQACVGDNNHEAENQLKDAILAVPGVESVTLYDGGSCELYCEPHQMPARVQHLAATVRRFFKRQKGTV